MSFSDPFLAWLDRVAERCLIVEVGVKSGGVEITRYLSPTGFVSEPGDTPPNEPYRARISGGVQFTRRLNVQGTGASISFGAIELDNSDGALDSWLHDIWAGRPIAAWLGQPDWTKAQFEAIYAGTDDDIVPKSRTTLALKLRDILGPLNSTLSTATIGGTDDNKDALRPICLGECFNLEPVLVDGATNTFAVHLDAPIENIIEVRDNGVSVPFTADLTHGTFTLTNARFGQITCDVQGAKIGGTWRNDAGGLIEWVATVLGDGNFITGGQIDAAALAAFRAANTQPLGLYIYDRANRLAVMQQLAASVGATVTQTYDGKLLLVKIGFGTPVGTLGTRQMVPGTFAPIGRPEIQGAIRINGERNWTPQAASAISASVTAAQLPIFGDEYVTLAATDATVLADWFQSAAPGASENLMVVESDISAEAARLLALWKVERTIFGVECFAETFAYEIGDTVTLVHERFGLPGGVPAQIIGVMHDWVNFRARLEVLV